MAMDPSDLGDRDCAAPGELTVTITLAEYRSLIELSAAYELRLEDAQKAADEERYRLQCEITRLTQKTERAQKQKGEAKGGWE